MQKFSLEVSIEDRGLRLDQYIIDRLDLPISRSRIQRLINAGHITVNGDSAKAHYKVKQNDSLLVNIPPPSEPKVLPQEISLDILFEDDDILVVNKPEGMVTHPAVGNYSGTLVNALLGQGYELSAISGPLRPGIVHRLDKETSGVMVVAKTDFAHQKLARQFQAHTVKRRYVAAVRGRLAHNEGVIDLPIGRDIHNRQKMAVNFLKKSRPALTRYKVLKRYRAATVLELTPHTGRTHQLRVHLESLNHPVLGDARYGRAAGFKRLALHAVLLGFEHPRTGEFAEFRSELPESFTALLESLK